MKPGPKPYTQSDWKKLYHKKLQEIQKQEHELGNLRDQLESLKLQTQSHEKLKEFSRFLSNVLMQVES